MSTDPSTSYRAHPHYARFTSPLTWTLACSLLFAGCGGSEGDAAPDPAATPGTVIAEVPTTTIGAQGGRVTSSDGRAWLDIPAGSLSHDVVWSISAEAPKLPTEFASGYEAVADSGYVVRSSGGSLPADRGAVLTIQRGAVPASARIGALASSLRMASAEPSAHRAADPASGVVALFADCEFGDSVIVFPPNDVNSQGLVAPIDGCLANGAGSTSTTHVAPVRVMPRVATPGWSRTASAAAGFNTGSDYYNGPGGVGRALAARGNQVAIVDEAGNLVLEATLQGLPKDFHPIQARLDGAGAFYVAGEHRTNCPNGNDLLIEAMIARFELRISRLQGSTAAMAWLHTVAGTPLAACPAAGPYQFNYFNGMAVDPRNGDVVFIGHAEGSSSVELASAELGVQGYFIARLSRSNALLWARPMPTKASDVVPHPSPSVSVAFDGSAYVASNSIDATLPLSAQICGALDVRVCVVATKFDSSGAQVWSRRVSAKAARYEATVATGTDVAGNLWVASAYEDVDTYSSVDAVRMDAASGAPDPALSIPGVYRFNPFGILRVDSKGRVLIGVRGDLFSARDVLPAQSGDYVYRLGTAPAYVVLGIGSDGYERGFGVDAIGNVIGIQLDAVTNKVACPSGRNDCPGLIFGSFVFPPP